MYICKMIEIFIKELKKELDLIKKEPSEISDKAYYYSFPPNNNKQTVGEAFRQGLITEKLLNIQRIERLIERFK